MEPRSLPGSRFHNSKRFLKKLPAIENIQEVWKPIPDFEGFYEVSNMGRIKSLERKEKLNPFGRKSIIKERILAPGVNTGYLRVGLVKDGARTSIYIHRAVALAFIQNTEKKNQVNHKDGNRQNNIVDNLEWVSNSDNQIHSYRVLQNTPPATKLSKDEVIKIRELRNEGWLMKDIAQRFKIDESHVSRICSKKIWRYVEKAA